MISTVNSNQCQIIKDIISLHCKGGIELDATYSKGVFYKNGDIVQPSKKFDINPQTIDTIKANANNLPIDSNSIKTMMFDPPFIVGHTTGKSTGKIGDRFGSFPYVKDLWKWYTECLTEFYRILETDGILIVKCQDTVSSQKQHLSHIYIISEAERIGFYSKDLFILTAEHRMRGHNHHKQYHARKHHSFFLVFEKCKKVKVKNKNLIYS